MCTSAGNRYPSVSHGDPHQSGAVHVQQQIHDLRNGCRTAIKLLARPAFGAKQKPPAEPTALSCVKLFREQTLEEIDDHLKETEESIKDGAELVAASLSRRTESSIR